MDSLPAGASEAVMRSGMNSSQIIVIILAAACALGCGATVMIKKIRKNKYKIKSGKDEWYANETDKIWSNAKSGIETGGNNRVMYHEEDYQKRVIVL